MKLVFLGAPGAGKGTQAEIICDKLNIVAVSTGNILREAVQNGTDLGKKAKEYMDSGNLVPDDVIIGIIKDRLAEPDCENGFILDGVPRTIAQAEAIEKMGIAIDKVVDIEVSDEEILRRLSGRRVCPECGAAYHIDSIPPRVEGICDKCGTELIIRKDDNPDTVKDRLKVYHEQTKPLIAFYEERGLLAIIEGQSGLENTTDAILASIGAQA